MILQLGSYEFPTNTVWFSPVQRLVTGQTGGYAYREHNWVIHEVIFEESGDPGTSAQPDLTTSIEDRESAVRNITGDVLFKNDDGTPTAHKIEFANTINGIKGTMVEYPGGLSIFGNRIWGSGSEYVDAPETYRYFVTQIRARTLDVEYEIVFYAQSWRYNVSGTQFSVQGSFTGIPRRFNIMANVPNWAIQRGLAVGATNWPVIPAPLVSSFAMDPDRSWLEPKTPQILGQQNQIFYPLEFEYFFRDPLPLPALPPPVV